MSENDKNKLLELMQKKKDLQKQVQLTDEDIWVFLKQLSNTVFRGNWEATLAWAYRIEHGKVNIE